MTKHSVLEQQLHLMSSVALNPSQCNDAASRLSDLKGSDLDAFLKLLNDHHTILRTLEPLLKFGNSRTLSWSEVAEEAIVRERNRIHVCLEYLGEICSALEAAGFRVVVFKTLDHWPDFGNDLDLFVMGDEDEIRNLLTRNFNAQTQLRSWGDHLAHKWSFNIPGCPADVELHINRLGQAGEHDELARRFITRRQYFSADGHCIPVPSPEERVIAATLQRMYRHLYFRVCDIVNLTTLLQTDELDWRELAAAADLGGIWPGVVGCLEIIAGYANRYLSQPSRLPAHLQAEANWSASKLRVHGRFLHIPFLPDGAGLFCRQFAHTLRNGNLDATARLSLLPPLASVAALAYAVTGSNGRIW